MTRCYDSFVMSFRWGAVLAVVNAVLLMPAGAQQTAYPNPSQLPVERATRGLVERALQEHRYDYAETLLIQEAQKKPRVPELLTFLGRLFFLDGKFLNCTVALSKADKLKPLNDKDRFTLAMAFAAMKRPDWARPELETLRRTQPKNALYVYWLGKLDFDEQNLPSAIERFEEAIQLDAGLVKAHDMLGVSQGVAGRYEQAARHFEEANRLNRLAAAPSPWPPLDYGSALLAAGNTSQAEPYLREALRYGPGLAKAHYLLASVLEKKHEDSEALDELKRAAKLDGSGAESWYALARLYRKAGRTVEAAEATAEFHKRAKSAKATVAFPRVERP